MKKSIEGQITCSCGCGKKFTPIRDFRTKIIKSKLHPDCLRIKNNKKLLAQSTMYTKKESTSFKTGKYATKNTKGGKRAYTKWEDKDVSGMIKHIQDDLCNPYIRQRDNECFNGKSISDNGSIHDAGHFFPTSTHNGMRFWVSNIHGQSTSSNHFKSGDLLNYRKGLINRHGQQYIDDLDKAEGLYKQNGYKFDRFNLLLIGKTFKYLLKKRVWVFDQSEFDEYKNEIATN